MENVFSLYTRGFTLSPMPPESVCERAVEPGAYHFFHAPQRQHQRIHHREGLTFKSAALRWCSAAELFLMFCPLTPMIIGYVLRLPGGYPKGITGIGGRWRGVRWLWRGSGALRPVIKHLQVWCPFPYKSTLLWD